jgi:SARP family transcriptional regulator, regulator of embCAB operon
VRILICGPLSIEVDSVALSGDAFPGRLGRRLWTFFVLNRRRLVGREELIGALWAEEAPDAVDASLNALVSRVRAAVAKLAPAIDIRAAAGSYTLHLPPEVFIDRERAWSAIHHVQSIRREGNTRDAWSEAVIASEIAGRGFLPGDDAPWITGERAVLRDIELQALEAIADALVDQGRPDEAERVARRLIAADPLREAGYRALMRALAAAGNPAQATRVMEECRRALAAVSARPSAQTEQLLRTILAGRNRVL